MEESDILEATANAYTQRNKWRVLAGIAGCGLIATEVLRRTVPGPPEARGAALLYWFADHVFFDGKWLVLLMLALAPARLGLPLKWLAPAAGALLIGGSFFQLGHPVFLGVIGLLLGAALKSVEDSESFDILLAIGGMTLGVPLNGFTGLMVAKAGFPPALMAPLFGSTAGVGSTAIACAMTGLYLLAWRLALRRQFTPANTPDAPAR